LTTAYQWFLARWAKRLACQEVADIFRTSWNTVYQSHEQDCQPHADHPSTIHFPAPSFTGLVILEIGLVVPPQADDEQEDHTFSDRHIARQTLRGRPTREGLAHDGIDKPNCTGAGLIIEFS